MDANPEICFQSIFNGHQICATERLGEQVFNIWHDEKANLPVPNLIQVVVEESTLNRYILLRYEKNTISALLLDAGTEVECSILTMPSQSILYERTSGLFEHDVLTKKKIAIVGLGSFGSHIAVELAKCGLGNFGLFDYDRLEPGNVTRHVCGLADVGRLKVLAVHDAILQCNPFAKVETFSSNINTHMREFSMWVQDSDLLICVTDENQSRINCTEVALRTGKVALFGRAITRAEGGDVLRFRPGIGPCLACLIGNGIFDYKNEEVSTLQQSKRSAPAYMDPKDIKDKVQVGLSADIIPIWNMIVRLALVELSRGISSDFESLEQDFSADYYFWVNRRENKYKAFKPMQFSVTRPSVLRWYGVNLPRNHFCLICGTELP